MRIDEFEFQDRSGNEIEPTKNIKSSFAVKTKRIRNLQGLSIGKTTKF